MALSPHVQIMKGGEEGRKLIPQDEIISPRAPLDTCMVMSMKMKDER